jgi:hypothetical protein
MVKLSRMGELTIGAPPHHLRIIDQAPPWLQLPSSASRCPRL